MQQRLEFKSPGSNKFWQIEQQGDQTTVRYGKIGSDGQTRTKKHASPEVAAAEAAKLIRAKTAKGYAAVDAFQIAAAPSVALPSDAPAPKGAVSLYDVRRADVPVGADRVPARRLKEAARTLVFCRGALQKFEKAVLETPVIEPVGERKPEEDPKAHSKRMVLAMFSKFDKVSPETREAVPALVKRFEDLFEGPRAALLQEPFAADLPREAVVSLADEVRAIGKAMAALDLPVGMHNPASNLQRFVGPKLDVPKLNPAGFEALSVSDRINAFTHPQRWDCEVDEVEGGQAAAEKLVGKAGVERIFEALWEAAEDSNADNEELSGEPWISIEVLRHGKDELAYQVSGHLEVEPYGGDFTYDLFADKKGQAFDESFR